jgi:hypothetical protein
MTFPDRRNVAANVKEASCMGDFMKLLDVSDIEALDEKQLRILQARAKDQIMHEICNNPQIRTILEPLMRNLYRQFAPRSQSGGGSQPPPRP